MAATVNGSTTAQSTSTLPSRAARAVAALTATTSSEVPTAARISKPRTSTRAGTTTNPPPTPKNPVSSPTALAVSPTRPARAAWSRGPVTIVLPGRARRVPVLCPSPSSSLCPGASAPSRPKRRSIAAAASSIKTAKPNSSSCGSAAAADQLQAGSLPGPHAAGEIDCLPTRLAQPLRRCPGAVARPADHDDPPVRGQTRQCLEKPTERNVPSLRRMPGLPLAVLPDIEEQGALADPSPRLRCADRRDAGQRTGGAGLDQRGRPAPRCPGGQRVAGRACAAGSARFARSASPGTAESAYGPADRRGLPVGQPLPDGGEVAEPVGSGGGQSHRQHAGLAGCRAAVGRPRRPTNG